jgi:ribosomal-protein-alanine N-acetyltransferase
VNVVAAEGLLLEPQVADHAAEMFAVLSDPAIYEHEGDPPQSVEWLRERFDRLESRLSRDGREQWLNSVIRLPSGDLAGYVQATVHVGGRAGIAYVLSSRFWGQGLARRAVGAMIGELTAHYGVSDLRAVLKRSNVRSLRLLERLGFEPAPAEIVARERLEADEMLMRSR